MMCHTCATDIHLHRTCEYCLSDTFGLHCDSDQESILFNMKICSMCAHCVLLLVRAYLAVIYSYEYKADFLWIKMLSPRSCVESTAFGHATWRPANQTLVPRSVILEVECHSSGGSSRVQFQLKLNFPNEKLPLLQAVKIFKFDGSTLFYGIRRKFSIRGMVRPASSHHHPNLRAEDLWKTQLIWTHF